MESPHSYSKLQLLRPMVSHLQRMTEEAVEWTRSQFLETWGMSPTLHTFDQLVRYYICQKLDQRRRDIAIPFERQPLLNDGIEVTCLGHSIKMQKMDKNGLRAPATYAMMAWHQRNQIEMFEFEEIIDIRSVVLLWDFTETFFLKDLHLALPNISEPPIPIPHLAIPQEPQQSNLNDETTDIPELDEPDDHDDTEEETGTEEL
jgi:hypothetical protein